MPRPLLSLLLFLFATIGSLTAQKIGHVNFGNLLNDLPTTTTSDEQLAAFSEELTEKGEAMVKKFEADYQKAQREAGDMAPIDRQKLIQKLEQDQLAIRNYEQQVQADVEKKRRELLGPIITEAKAAIEKVAKANGFDLVVDSSIFNSVLYVDEGANLMELVKKELGL